MMHQQALCCSTAAICWVRRAGAGQGEVVLPCERLGVFVTFEAPPLRAEMIGRSAQLGWLGRAVECTLTRAERDENIILLLYKQRNGTLLLHWAARAARVRRRLCALWRAAQKIRALRKSVRGGAGRRRASYGLQGNSSADTSVHCAQPLLDSPLQPTDLQEDGLASRTAWIRSHIAATPRR